MKTYRSHKTVEAAKVLGVAFQVADGSCILTLQGDKTEVRELVPHEWTRKHAPSAAFGSLIGGYFVRYADGYTSWSPAEAFEGGYTEASLDPKDGALPVAGYKPQTSEKVAVVNSFKASEERMLRMLDALAANAAAGKGGVPVDARWLSIGRTALEQAFMAINRAVFQPGRATLPEDAAQ